MNFPPQVFLRPHINGVELQELEFEVHASFAEAGVGDGVTIIFMPPKLVALLGKDHSGPAAVIWRQWQGTEYHSSKTAPSLCLGINFTINEYHRRADYSGKIHSAPAASA